jgi:hypothetical protein
MGMTWRSWKLNEGRPVRGFLLRWPGGNEMNQATIN